MADTKTINKILLCLDNSDLSLRASQAALSLAKTFEAEVVGIHGYNAFMHEGAFRIMEPTLPSEYQPEEILQKQRDVHHRLIHVGMEKISLSYLRPVQSLFTMAGVPFKPRVKEGKNFKALNEILSEEGGDLVVMGSSGFSGDCDGFVGSVCLRVLRGNNSHFLIIKKGLVRERPRFVVGLDGSPTAIGALKMAKLLAERFDGELHLLYVFDGKLHKEIFGRLKESLINEEGFSFHSREQEKMHDEFIDKCLEKVGRLILDKAEKIVFPPSTGSQLIQARRWAGVPGTSAMDGWGLAGEGLSFSMVKKVLEGPAHRRICDYASEINADLICVGRTGRHFAEGMDIGSVTENIVRFSPCDVLVTQSSEHKAWEI